MIISHQRDLTKFSYEITVNATCCVFFVNAYALSVKYKLKDILSIIRSSQSRKYFFFKWPKM